MAARPALTIITPTYNRADFLPETINSILSQDFFDIEYIILDDGSTDDTHAVIRSYINRHAGRLSHVNIQYLRHDNVGETRTVNKGLSMVRGNYFTIVNSDDPLLPGSLSKVISALERVPSALAAYPDWRTIDQHSRALGDVRIDDYDLKKLFSIGYVPIGPGACFRREALETVGYRDPLLKYSADLDYWYRLALVSPLIHVPEVLATHRVHPASASTSDKGKRLADETAYLFSGRVRHPLFQGGRRYYALAEAHAQFAGMFADSNLLEAKRRFARGFLSHPKAMLERCRQAGSSSLAQMFLGLGATRNGRAHNFFAESMRARDRTSCVSTLVRGIFADPVGMIELADETGYERIANHLTRLQRYPQRGTGVPVVAPPVDIPEKLPTSANYAFFAGSNNVFSHSLKLTRRNRGKYGEDYSPPVRAECHFGEVAAERAIPTSAPEPTLRASEPTLAAATTEELAAAFAARLRDTTDNRFSELFSAVGFHLLRKHD